MEEEEEEAVVVAVDEGMPKQNETLQLREERGGVQRLEDPDLNGTGPAPSLRRSRNGPRASAHRPFVRAL